MKENENDGREIEILRAAGKKIEKIKCWKAKKLDNLVKRFENLERTFIH